MNKNKKFTRRRVVKSGAVVGAAIGSGLITGFPAVHSQEAPTIRYLGTAVNMGSEPEKKLFEDTGIKVISIIGTNRAGVFLHLMPIFGAILAMIISVSYTHLTLPTKA